MNKCANCGEKYTLGFRDRVLRGAIHKLARQFPALRKVTLKTKDYCNPCYHQVLDPIANALKIPNKEEIMAIKSQEEYTRYPVTLVFNRGSDSVRKEVDLLDPYSDNVVHTYVDLNGWVLVDVDDNCGEDPAVALNAITSQQINRKLIKREVKHFRKLYKLLKAQE